MNDVRERMGWRWIVTIQESNWRRNNVKTFKSISALLLLAFMFQGTARPNLFPLTTITGTGATVQISASNTAAKFIQLIAPSGNSAAVNFGDSTITSTPAGVVIAPGGAYNTPACSSCSYTLSAHYVYVANGDKIYLSYGK